MPAIENPMRLGGVPGKLLPQFGLVLLAALIGIALGKDLNWDQLNYHYYIAHAFLNDRLHVDFMAASVQSYLNPLAHLPFYLLASSNLSSMASTGVLGAIHGLNFILVYAICQTVLRAAAHRNTLALIFTAVSASNPVVVAELGTSLAELIASLPVLAGILMLLKLDGFDPRRRQGLAAGAFLLLGAGAALKLPFAIFTIACVPLLLLQNRRPGPLLVSLVLGGAATVLGFILAGGFHNFAVWQKFGNPFFPFFNNIFLSPDYPPIKLVNDRFIQDTLPDILAYPFRMLSSSRFVTTEQTVVDPRYCMIIGAAAALGLARFRRKRQGSALPAMPWAAVALLTVFAVAFPLWCLTSGNGRYGLPLHLLCGPVLAALLVNMNLDGKRLLAWGGLCLALVAAILAATFKEAVWTRAAHTDHWYKVAIPDAVKVDGALYLSAGHHDRTSNSFLIPYFPSGAKFANINGYANLAAGHWGGARVDQLIADNGRRPIFIIAESSPDPKDIRQRASWIGRQNINLQGYGLALDELDKCHRIFDGNVAGSAAFATICPLVKRPRDEARTHKKRTDAAFDALEAANPKVFYPRGDLSYFRNEKTYCRFYASTEYYLCERDGALSALRLAPLKLVRLGRLEDAGYSAPAGHAPRPAGEKTLP